jgi:hypothetical protein
MPRQQSTAAKKARAAARQGAKYTTALREEQVNNALYLTGARPSGFSAAFDLANSPAVKAARAAADLANSPAVKAARAAADLANSPAVKAARTALENHPALRATVDLANSPAFQAAALAGFPDLDKLQKSMDQATAFAVRFTPPA